MKRPRGRLALLILAFVCGAGIVWLVQATARSRRIEMIESSKLTLLLYGAASTNYCIRLRKHV